jgi:hypothetical protein
MNRVYVVSQDGRIFFAESNSETFELLEATSYNNKHEECSIQVKRLTSCSWALWTISSSFKVYLYIFELDTPYEFQEIIYENQVKTTNC